MNTTATNNTVAGISYTDVAILFALMTLAVAVGVWAASKVSA